MLVKEYYKYKMNMKKNSVLAKIHTLLPFYLILTRGPKNELEGDCIGVLYILLEFWQKIMVIPVMNPLLWFMICLVCFRLFFALLDQTIFVCYNDLLLQGWTLDFTTGT